MTSASDLTAEHYQHPEVEETILRCSQDGGAWRCLNGDQGWYITTENGGVRLRRPEDYDKTTEEFRTLYWSLDFFEPEVHSITEKWDEGRKRPVHPIGTLRECRAYSLGVDIDAVGHNAFDDPNTTKALEEAATFLIDHLRVAGIEKSVYALCSGGGVYVLIHHALFTAKSEWSGEAREARFRHLLEMYNAFIRDTAAAFFEAHPEYVGRVVFDALNGQKRKFKTIFSVHKSVPAVVVPLDPQCIKISKKDATIPLSSEVLERGEAWYREYDLAEKVLLQELLRPYDEAAKKKLERRKTETGSYDLFRRDAPTLPDEWCPLMQRIAREVTAGEIGRHAALGNLARHLYADGWSMEAAFRLWSPLADQAGVEYRIFDTSFGEISEARCEVINEPRAGYPASSLGGTRFTEACKACPRREAGGFPSDYAHPKSEEATTSTEEDDGIKSITEEELNGLNISARPKLHNGLEDDHFISQYMEYGAATSDAYPEYHYSGASTLLSVAVGRKLVLKLKQERIYPNIWSFNLGPSTISRKSTALGKTEEMLRTVCPNTAIPKSFSPEALIEFLSEYPVSYLVKDEVGHLLANMRKPYMEEVRDFFSEIYDNRDFRRKLRTGKRKDKTDFQITNPYIVQSYATTNTLFREYTTTLDLTSGWLLRFLYFAPNYRKPSMAFGLETGVEAELYGRSLGRFSGLYRLFSKLGETPIEPEPEAMEYFQRWQLNTEEALMRENDEVALSLFGRLQVYALKLAVLFTIGRRGYKVGDKISLSYMKEAVRQVDEYFLPVGRAVVLEVGRSELTNLQNRIIGCLERRGGKMKRPDLLRDLHVRIKDVGEALEALTESGEMETRIEEKPGRKPAIWYILIDSSPNSNNRHDSNNRNNSSDSPPNPGFIDTIAANAIISTIATDETRSEEVVGDSEFEDYQPITEGLEGDERRQVEKAEKFRTPEPKARPSEKDIAEALEIAEGLKVQGRRVTFGNVEDFTEARTGGYVEPKVVWRVLKTLEFLGWGTGKDGAMSPPSEGVAA